MGGLGRGSFPGVLLLAAAFGGCMTVVDGPKDEVSPAQTRPSLDAPTSGSLDPSSKGSRSEPVVDSAPSNEPSTDAKKPEGREASAGPLRPSAPAVKVVVSVDWEGESLEASNIARMAWLRAQYPDVPMVQLLNAAYYTKPGADASAVTKALASTLLPGDELGVHVHGWKTLFEASGVVFRPTPNLFGQSLDSHKCSYDCGFDVPLSAYTEAELRKVFAFSVRTLESQGFGRARSFRAGAWVATDHVRKALAAEGFAFEHSPVPWVFLDKHYRGTLLEQIIRPLWAGMSNTSQPYELDTGRGPLTEIPDNGCLADYMPAEAMLRVFDANVAEFRKDPTKSVVVSIGFHQETAEDWYKRLVGALDGIVKRARTVGVPVRFVTSAEAAQH